MLQHTFKTGFTTKFEYFPAKRQTNNNINVVYIHGLCSAPWGAKPEVILSYCQESDIGFFRFELAGHGSDAQNFKKVNFDIWVSQVLEVIDTMVEGPIILAGTSLGGWLALIAAKERPRRVIGVLGLAAAPDFTYDLMNKYLSNYQKEELERQGQTTLVNNDFEYIFTKDLIDSSLKYCLLNQEQIPIDCPVELVQGQQDLSVDWRKVLVIAEKLRTQDVNVKIIKSANHRLNRDFELTEVLTSFSRLLSRFL